MVRGCSFISRMKNALQWEQPLAYGKKIPMWPQIDTEMSGTARNCPSHEASETKLGETTNLRAGGGGRKVV